MIELIPWSNDDLIVLQKLNSPEARAFLGGPEDADKVVARHQRYLQTFATGKPWRMFTVVLKANGEKVGSTGYWERQWHDEKVLETGWGILAEFQGRGFATMAAFSIVAQARTEGFSQFIHAYPKVTHAASNAICKKAGFVKVAECDFEYPPGHVIRVNDWQFDLFAQV